MKNIPPTKIYLQDPQKVILKEVQKSPKKKKRNVNYVSKKNEESLLFETYCLRKGQVLFLKKRNEYLIIKLKNHITIIAAIVK